MPLEDKININLNQNLWGLVVAYGSLGAAERFHLSFLFWLSAIVSVGLSVSVLLTFGFYTYRYCKRKVE